MSRDRNNNNSKRTLQRNSLGLFAVKVLPIFFKETCFITDLFILTLFNSISPMLTNKLPQRAAGVRNQVVLSSWQVKRIYKCFGSMLDVLKTAVATAHVCFVTAQVNRCHPNKSGIDIMSVN